MLDANLGAVAVRCSAAVPADQIRVGAASGGITIVVADLSGSNAAEFNSTYIHLFKGGR